MAAGIVKSVEAPCLRMFDTTASPLKLWGPARRMRISTVRPIQSDALPPFAFRESASAPGAGTEQFTTVLPLVRPEISAS